MLPVQGQQPAWLPPVRPLWSGGPVVVALLVGWAFIQTLRAMFKPEVTFGDVLAIAVPLLLATAYAVYRARRNIKPFVLMFADQPFDSDAGRHLRRTFSRSLNLNVGSAPITLALRTKIPTAASPFGIRLVERSMLPWRWQNVPTGTAEIHSVRLPEWEREPGDVKKEPDDAGGWIVSTKEPKPWIVGQYLWIEVVVVSREHWTGHISFDGRTTHRAFVRRRIKIRHSSRAN